MPTTECRLKCFAKQGAFEDEMLVRITSIDSAGKESEAECLAYRNSVELEGQLEPSTECKGVLKAYCLQRKKEFAVVVLPQSTFQNGPTVIVKESDLLE